MKKGDRVVIEGHPANFGWLSALMGRTATIKAIRRIRKKSTKETATICTLDVPEVTGDIYLSALYLSKAPETEED